jgi:DNA-binding response OmpR family regulator
VVLALTALALAADRAKVLSAGYLVYAAKPVDAVQVLAAVAAWRSKGPPDARKVV